MGRVTERTKVEEYSDILFGVGVYVGAWRGSFSAIPAERSRQLLEQASGTLS